MGVGDSYPVDETLRPCGQGCLEIAAIKQYHLTRPRDARSEGGESVYAVFRTLS